MDVFSHKLAALSLSTALVNGGAAFAQEDEIVDIQFDSLVYAGETNRVHVTGLVVSQGDLTIEADEAAANRFDTERSEWRLDGDVRITVGTVRINGETAEFSLRDDRLERFELRGTPASFEDLEPQTAGHARGSSDRLTYDVSDAVVGLLGDAELSVGRNAVVGCDLLYNVEEETFRSGSSECDRPFQIRIVPSEDAGSGEP